ncbi:MAG: hypothetical protein FWF56_05855 [Firmicutes bacterium]|nr:hypothetical protein [Bacillota bacterium]MCL1953506.1 hypothetical protein [Bacillota bacterium]
MEEKEILMLGKFDAGKTTYWTTAIAQINKGLNGNRLHIMDANDRLVQKQNVKKIKKGHSVGNTRLVNKTAIQIQEKTGLIGGWKSQPDWPIFVVTDTPGGLTEEAFLSESASADITQNLEIFHSLFESYASEESDTSPSGVIMLFSCADFLGTLRDEEKLELMTNQLNTLVDAIAHLKESRGIATHIVFSMHDRVHETIKAKVAEIISTRNKDVPFAFVNSTDVKGDADDWSCGKTFVYVIRNILENDGIQIPGIN